MTIPTRDELIERIPGYKGWLDSDLKIVADFALAEILRAVAEELAELHAFAVPRNWDEGGQEERARWSDILSDRLAALRQTEQPPGAATVAEPLPKSAPKKAGDAAGSTPAPGATLSDADVLDKAAEILDKSTRGLGGVVREVAAKLRAASAPVPVPEPVDVFDVTARRALKCLANIFSRHDIDWLAEMLRAWFGPLVAALENAAEGECDDPPSLDNWTCSGCWPCEAKKILAALRQRAQEAS